MKKHRAENYMIGVLQRIVGELKGIDESELTKAEKNIISIVEGAIVELTKLVLEEKR